MMPTNWLGAGPLIAAKVDAAAPELTRVQIVSGLGEAMEINTESPAAYIHWAGDALSDHAGRGIAARAVQRWMVTIAVAQRNALRAPPYATLAAELDCARPTRS